MKSYSNTHENINKPQTAARAIVAKGNEILLVSNDGNMWYTPGGRQEYGELLTKCVEREVFEETGLKIKAGQFMFLYEFFDEKRGAHKVESYFHASVISGTVSDKWVDQGGPVKHIKFFKLNQLQEINVQPEMLKKGQWLYPDSKVMYEHS